MTERLTVHASDYGYIDISYRQIVETFGSIVVGTEWGSYQGDSLFLVRRADDYGLLTFGWGSCSGCDALQACSSQADVDRVQHDLERGIRWFDGIDAAVAFLDGGGFRDSFLDTELLDAFRGELAKTKEVTGE